LREKFFLSKNSRIKENKVIQKKEGSGYDKEIYQGETSIGVFKYPGRDALLLYP
jgi:hypothetical protein